jgi:hypothetical protein
MSATAKAKPLISEQKIETNLIVSGFTGHGAMEHR